MDREKIIDEIRNYIKENAEMGWVNADEVLRKINNVIPEGSMILSEEEYDNLVKFNDIKPDLLARQLGFNAGFNVGALQILTGVYSLLELIKDKEDAKVLLNHIEFWEEDFGVKVDR